MITRRFWPEPLTFIHFTLFDPVDIELALRELPLAIRLHERVVIPQSGEHQASLPALNREVMGHAISFTCAFVGTQRQYRGLPEEVHGRGVLVQVRKDWSQFLAQVEFDRWLRVLG